MEMETDHRMNMARQVAAHYARHPAVGAIVLGGSVARGTAGPTSDLDLGIFWHQLPSIEELDDLMTAYGGQLERRVDNARRYKRDNPRRHGCIEILQVPDDDGATPFDLEHETVAGTEEVFIQTLEEYNPSLENQEVLAVLRDGIYLYQSPKTAHWQERAAAYPAALAQRLVKEQTADLAALLTQQQRWLAAGDWICFQEGTQALVRRLFLAVLALNRVWAHTDNPAFKGMGGAIGNLGVQPEDFSARLGSACRADAQGIALFAALGRQVLELAEDAHPELDVGAVRRALADF